MSSEAKEMEDVADSWNPVEVIQLPRCSYLLNTSYKLEGDALDDALNDSMSCYFEGKCKNKHEFDGCESVNVDGEKQYGFCKRNPAFRP